MSGSLPCTGSAEEKTAHEPESTVAVDVLTKIVIERPPDTVATYAADPSNAPAWYANITSVTWETSPPLRPGSRVAFTAQFLGRHLAYTYQITDFTPGQRLVMGTAQGPFPMETTYTWQPTDDGSTLMTLRNRGEPAGFGAIAAPLIAIAMKHATRKDLRNLKAILETGVT
jgi:uncharacterized membrane protein